MKYNSVFGIDTLGNKSWRITTDSNNKVYFRLLGAPHREDGPAYIGINGQKEWWIEGIRHRVDGPAIEFPDGYKMWYLHGKEYNPVEWMVLVHILTNES